MLSQPGPDRHLKSYMVAEQRDDLHDEQYFVGLLPPERDLTRRQHDRSGHSPNHQHYRHRAIREEEPITQDYINQVIDYINILHIQHTDTGCSCVCYNAATVTLHSTCAQKQSEKETLQVSTGWTSITLHVHGDA